MRFSKIQHNMSAARKTPHSGQSVCREKPPSVISSYPHAAGKSFPAITNAFGSISLGNMMPDSIMEGRKIRIENRDVFAESLTANPIMLAILSDTAIRTVTPLKYAPVCSGIAASKIIGAVM